MTRKLGISSISPDSSRPPYRHNRHRRRKTQINSRYKNQYFDTSRSESSNQDQFRPDSISDDPLSTDGVSSQVPESVFERNSFRARTSPSLDAKNSPNFSPPLNEAISYISIAPLPVFRGTQDECPIAHLSRFLKVCRANNAYFIEMMMRIFPVTLESEAALWYDLNIEPYASLSWDEVKLSFLQAYNRIDIADQLRSELMMINQGNYESVRSYFLRLQWILKQWPNHGLEDRLVKGIFVDGLKEDFQNWIVPQKPSSLNDALSLAFSYEQVKSIRGNRVKGLIKCGFCDGMHDEQDCEIRGKMRVLWLRNKDKQLVVSQANDRGDDVALRSVSNGASSSAGKNEVLAQKCIKCQCSKHQCWKKKFERNNSLSKV